MIDLSTAQWIDISALTLIMAVVKTRLHESQQTIFRLPRSSRVRDFLRAWDFPACIRTATGHSFRQFVHKDDYKYFGEQQRHYLPRTVADPLTSLHEQLVSERFFGYTSYQLVQTAKDVDIIEAESNRWSSKAVDHALGRRMGDGSGDLARIIIFEMITNVVQHPGANITSVVSFANPLRTKQGTMTGGVGATRANGDNFLTICVWDDGLGVPETLRGALNAEGQIRVQQPPMDNYYEIKAEGWQPSRTRFHCSWTPDPVASDAEFLLASLFPGISQKGNPQVAEALRSRGSKPFQESGMGLYALYKSAVDHFGGSIAIRTGQLFLNMKRPATKTSKALPDHTYSVRIRRLRDSQRIDGNMFTIRLPLRQVRA